MERRGAEVFIAERPVRLEVELRRVVRDRHRGQWGAPTAGERDVELLVGCRFIQSWEGKGPEELGGCDCERSEDGR